jgi:hypothetical protein
MKTSHKRPENLHDTNHEWVEIWSDYASKLNEMLDDWIINKVIPMYNGVNAGILVEREWRWIS